MINHENRVYVRDSKGSVLLVRIKEAISPASNIIIVIEHPIALYRSRTMFLHLIASYVRHRRSFTRSKCGATFSGRHRYRVWESFSEV